MHPRPELTPAQHAVLCQLVVGTPRRVIARSLHLGDRAVDARIAEINRYLGTTQRLCLGARAIRSALVDPQNPIDQARRARRAATWSPPTTRQLQIVRLLAEDAPADTVCRELGVSTRTIRRDVFRLASANGARDLIHAGALFEVLGWIRPSAPAPATPEPPEPPEKHRGQNSQTRW